MIEGVEIEIGPATRAGGWHLLQGQLRRQGGAYDARLCLDLGDGFAQDAGLPVPTSVKGTINQLVFLPAGVTRVALEPGFSASQELDALRIRPVGAWERRWRMLQRVVPLLWTLSRAKRLPIRLTWRRALVDLAGAYEAASRLRAYAAAPAYGEWIRQFDELTDSDMRRIHRAVAGWQDPPFFHVALVGEDEQALRRSRASLQAQLHGRFELAELAGAASIERFNTALEGAAGSKWVLLLRAGDVLAPHALYWLAHVARGSPQATVIYSDEDELDASGQRCHHEFKPDWSWALSRSKRFTGDAVVLRADALWRAGGLLQEDCRHGCYGAMLRVLDSAKTDADASVRHVPAVLLHRAGGRPSPDDGWAMDQVRAHLARRGLRAQVEHMRPGCWRVRHPLPAQPPLVSIIVPTRDALALTRLCIDSVRRHTRYSRYEILLVDNQSTDAEALAWMRSQHEAGAVRLLRYDAPFNYAAINNMAVQQAAGELVCLLNNDTEVMQPGWLEEMVSHALQAGVDVVGAKLLYPNGLVQHAGDLVGVGGVANHAHAFLRSDDPGYCDRAVVAQEYSAVTAACLLTWRNRYLALGGLDATRLPVAFNDVDYCLRVREAGGRVVWTPHAMLVHHESVSRGKDLSRQQLRRAKREAAWMRRRWRHVLGRDPFYNPNLSHERPDFSLSHAPVVDRPWTS